MLDKTTHPFIFNTLVSSGKWSLDVSHFKSASLWAVSTVFDDDMCHENTTVATGSTAQEALDRLESALAGREYVANKPRDPEREAYLARWKNAPEWAKMLQQFQGGNCMWIGGGRCGHAGENLLGSVRCEPRPVL